MARSEIVLDQLVELINHHGGIDAISEAVGTLLNTAMRIERADVLDAEPYERTDRRQGYANGYKSKTLHTPPGTNIQPRGSDCPGIAYDRADEPSAVVDWRV